MNTAPAYSALYPAMQSRTMVLFAPRPFSSITSRLTMLLIALITPVSLPALSGQPIDSASSDQQIPVYSPPKKFIPRARVGGEMRGGEPTAPVVQPLVPDHVGFTSQEQPVLNWYLSMPTEQEVRFTLIDNKSVKPIFESPIPSPKKEGIFSIDMKDLNLALKPGVQYRWYISVQHPSSPESIGGGIIERCELSDCLVLMDARMTCSIQSVRENARAGLWYDAMGCLCTLIDANPTDASLRRMRAGLLKQVGLIRVAEWDLRSIQTPSR